MEYLVRFLTKSEYVWQLLYGQLNMFPAAYYIHTREQGRKDKYEGAVSKTAWMDIQTPIYCMTKLDGDPSGGIQVDRRIIHDFCQCGGYAVIIDKQIFSDCMNLLAKNQRLISGEVIYDLNPGDLPDSVPQNLPEIERVLLHKSPQFAYQKEYRFAFPDVDVTFWPLENEWYKVPWKPTIKMIRDSIWVNRIPPICKIDGDAFSLSIDRCPDPLRGEWLLEPRN